MSAEGHLKGYLSKLRDAPVTIILFGSRGRGKFTALSDYDLLVVRKSEEVSADPAQLEPMLPAMTLEVLAEELEALMYDSSLILAALIEGKVLLDNLGLSDRLDALRRKALEEGAEVGKALIKFPTPKPGPDGAGQAG